MYPQELINDIDQLTRNWDMDSLGIESEYDNDYYILKREKLDKEINPFRLKYGLLPLSEYGRSIPVVIPVN